MQNKAYCYVVNMFPKSLNLFRRQRGSTVILPIMKSSGGWKQCYNFPRLWKRQRYTFSSKYHSVNKISLFDSLMTCYLYDSNAVRCVFPFLRWLMDIHQVQWQDRLVVVGGHNRSDQLKGGQMMHKSNSNNKKEST